MDLPSPSATRFGVWPTPMAGSWPAPPGAARVNHPDYGWVQVPAMVHRSLTTRVIGCARVGAGCAHPERATVPGPRSSSVERTHHVSPASSSALSETGGDGLNPARRAPGLTRRTVVAGAAAMAGMPVLRGFAAAPRFDIAG